MRTAHYLPSLALAALLLSSCSPDSTTKPADTAATAVAAPAFTAADAQQIRTVLSTQAAAWNRGDLPAYMQGYWQSDSLLFIGKSGPQHGWQRTLTNYQRSYPDAAAMGQLDFSQLRINPIDAEAAHVVGRWHLARPQKGDLQGWFTLLFRKIDGRWVIVADHSS
ncbi:YybH family protein [Hymenobacter jeollabukensis]|uniref:Nuclear transport factor 2 family protein n=1 Tax=Hymenobacter jeollabukensis TaxID=2025313 RepID=A0A5R8WVK2_9BACT|nr:nuclear transport factor 2 family protein [Hymenobacter jeollabukensis]TLM96466.1 nuclear transport factor 2 family protein [Hymenobacter jeollabukensis]